MYTVNGKIPLVRNSTIGFDLDFTLSLSDWIYGLLYLYTENSCYQMGRRMGEEELEEERWREGDE